MCIEGALPWEFLVGDIVLLPKKGNKEHIEKKRPITLLNIVYKIFAKVW